MDELKRLMDEARALRAVWRPCEEAFMASVKLPKAERAPLEAAARTSSEAYLIGRARAQAAFNAYIEGP